MPEEIILDPSAEAEANYQSAVRNPPGRITIKRKASKTVKFFGTLFAGSYLALMGVGVVKYNTDLLGPNIKDYPLVETKAGIDTELGKTFPAREVLANLSYYQGLEAKLIQTVNNPDFNKQSEEYDFKVDARDSSRHLLGTVGLFGLIPFFAGVGLRKYGKSLNNRYEAGLREYEIEMRKEHLYKVVPK